MSGARYIARRNGCSGLEGGWNNRRSDSEAAYSDGQSSSIGLQGEIADGGQGI